MWVEESYQREWLKVPRDKSAHDQLNSMVFHVINDAWAWPYDARAYLVPSHPVRKFSYVTAKTSPNDSRGRASCVSDTFIHLFNRPSTHNLLLPLSRALSVKAAQASNWAVRAENEIASYSFTLRWFSIKQKKVFPPFFARLVRVANDLWHPAGRRKLRGCGSSEFPKWKLFCWFLPGKAVHFDLHEVSVEKVFAGVCTCVVCLNTSSGSVLRINNERKNL